MHCDREKSQKKEKSRSWYGFSSQMYMMIGKELKMKASDTILCINSSTPCL